MKKTVFWDVAPCASGVNRRFGGTYRLQIQGRRGYVPPKRRITPLLHGATSQKMLSSTLVLILQNIY
jgi:hypothetical protein